MAPSTTENTWDIPAIRRAMRLIGSHVSRIGDDLETARAMRRVWHILQRCCAPVNVFQLPGIMPLITVGTGRTLLITYLDDPSLSYPSADTDVPLVSGNLAVGPGVKRKAGLLAAIGVLAGGRMLPEDVTLVIEADRHRGSLALGSWLDTTNQEFAAAVWEAADLPIPTPAVFRSATGIVTMRIMLRSRSPHLENFYAGIVPDVGHLLSEALTGIRSHDSEVLIPAFYDGVRPPDGESLALLQSVSPVVHAWITRDMPAVDDHLSPEHMTLGVFFTPSIMVREMIMIDAQPHLPREAHATIEARLMPGQNPHGVIRSITDYVSNRVPDAEIETLLIRPPSTNSSMDISSLPDGVSAWRSRNSVSGLLYRRSDRNTRAGTSHDFIHHASVRIDRILVPACFPANPRTTVSLATTVVIVNFNGGEHLLRCLSALGCQSMPHRTLIVDNASTVRLGVPLTPFRMCPSFR
jgi:hypothetical protein